MRTGFIISGTGHAAVLVWCVLTFVLAPQRIASIEPPSIDVEVISDTPQVTSGTKNAPLQEHPKPLADKVADATPPVPDPAAKVAKKEIKAATDVPPVPEPKPPEPKAKKPPQPAPPVDAIADALKKDEDKKPDPKKPVPPPPTPPKKPVQQEPAPTFDPRQVAALLDKRASQRVASASDVPSTATSLGLEKSKDAQLSQDEKGALRARLEGLWNVPAGVRDPRELTLDVEIKLNPDGNLAAAPIVLTSGNSPMFVAASESAVRAVYKGQPYTMLRPEHYELWKDIIVTFDPQHLLGN
jgi:outer membrane biosynthesis protein TonB